MSSQKDNTITHIEIPAPDLSKALNFYPKIFNWKVTVAEENKYAFFRIGELNIGGAFDTGLKPGEERQGIQMVVDVENINETLELIEAAGGMVTLPKTEIPGGHGFYAEFKDPNGVRLQLHARV